LHTHDPEEIPSFDGVANLLAQIVRARRSPFVVVGDYHTSVGIGLVPLLLAIELSEYRFAPSARGIDSSQALPSLRIELADGVDGLLPLKGPMIIQPHEPWTSQPAPSLEPAFHLATGAVAPKVVAYRGPFVANEVHLPIRRPTSVVAPPVGVSALDRLRDMIIAWPQLTTDVSTLADAGGPRDPAEAAREILATLHSWGVI
jgi:hypothetical protein